MARRSGRARVGRGLSGWTLLLSVLALVCSGCAAVADVYQPTPFAGWAAETKGGIGGQVVRVTNLNGAGEGSLRAALNTAGPRVIVFEVGGVIDLQRQSLNLSEPYVTIAGQTAPSPGITLIRGGLNIATHDVVVQHIRIRVGADGASRGSGWEAEAISTRSASNVVVDHCSLTWATDENLSASGPRAEGDTLEEWRANTSHSITFSHNIIAEGLADSSHAKFEHSKGSLIHDNVTELLIYGNLYAHNYERSPLFKGGVHSLVVNNFIYDPGQRAIHYNLMVPEWGAAPMVPGVLSLVGNVMRAGPSTESPIALMMLGGHGPVQVYMQDNIAVDRIGEPLPLLGRYSTDSVETELLDSPAVWWPGLDVLPASEVEKAVLLNVGARPWDRDWHDVRVLANAAEGRGDIIDDESEVGGYPEMPQTRRSFNVADWDLQAMWPNDPSLLDNSKGSGGT